MSKLSVNEKQFIVVCREDSPTQILSEQTNILAFSLIGESLTLAETLFSANEHRVGLGCGGEVASMLGS